MAYDPEHRLVLSVVPGKRTAANARLLVADFQRRTGGRLLDLITTDDYRPYRQAIWYAYARPWVPPRRHDRRGRPVRTYRVPPPESIMPSCRRGGGTDVWWESSDGWP